MKLVIDVGYHGQVATAAGVLFENWRDAKPAQELRIPIEDVAPYEPGLFYKRELPCIMKLLESVNDELDAIVVDGFVWLSNDAENPKPGLGAYLYEKLDKKVDVIGVAKTQFVGSGAAQLLRGKSKRPLFVSAAGIDLVEAIHLVNSMHGPNRIPTLLKRVDQLSRIVD